MLSLAVMACIGVSMSPSAQGQDYHERWDRGRLSRFAFALGYDRGYTDATQNSYRTYRDVQRYREGTEGWEDPMGTRTIFRDSFRRGFAQGFMDGRYGRPRRLSQSDADRIRAELRAGGRNPYDRDSMARIADQNGFRDGLRLGRIDAHRGRRTDYESMSSFRTGMSGFRSQFGDRELYRQAYRDGFRRGYEEGFSGRG